MTMKAEIIWKNVDFLLERAELMARQATDLEDMKLAKNDCKILLGLIQKTREG